MLSLRPKRYLGIVVAAGCLMGTAGCGNPRNTTASGLSTPSTTVLNQETIPIGSHQAAPLRSVDVGNDPACRLVSKDRIDSAFHASFGGPYGVNSDSMSTCVYDELNQGYIFQLTTVGIRGVSLQEALAYSGQSMPKAFVVANRRIGDESVTLQTPSAEVIIASRRNQLVFVLTAVLGKSGNSTQTLSIANTLASDAVNDICGDNPCATVP